LLGNNGTDQNFKAIRINSQGTGTDLLDQATQYWIAASQMALGFGKIGIIVCAQSLQLMSPCDNVISLRFHPKPIYNSIIQVPAREKPMKIVRLEDAKNWPELRPFTPEELQEAYALARAAFTADDLQKFTEGDEGVPMDEFLEELEKVQQEHDLPTTK
jgi:hypothetical protein